MYTPNIMLKAVFCLSVYATLCTIVVGLLSYVLSRQLACEIKSEVSGNENLVRNNTKYNILSVDLSKDGNNKCRVWSSMGFEAFELLMMVLLTLFLIYKLGRRVCGKDGLIAKRKAAKLQSNAKKFEKLKQRFE